MTCVLQTAVAGYALRLNRVFGTARVGWSLFAAFGILAVLHLTQAAGLDQTRPLSVSYLSGTYLVISILLLIGLAHIDVVMRMRSVTEREQARTRDELEALVEARTADLATANHGLRKALAQVKRLSGILPICSGCKKIRDDAGYWKEVESYISEHSEAWFSHGLCPDCFRRYLGQYQEMVAEDEARAKAAEQPEPERAKSSLVDGSPGAGVG